MVRRQDPEPLGGPLTNRITVGFIALPVAISLQAEIDVEDEFVDRKLPSDHPRRTPRELGDLFDAGGDEFAADARRRFQAPAYKSSKVTDVAAFVDAAQAPEAPRRDKTRPTTSHVTDTDMGAGELNTEDDLSPGWDRYPVTEKRLFNERTLSSAGRSGARICDHWFMQTTDSTGDSGERWMSPFPSGH